MFSADSYLHMLGKRPHVPRKKEQKKGSVKYYAFHQSNFSYAGFFLLYFEHVSCFYLFAANTKKPEN